jgi:hypothetical protein
VGAFLGRGGRADPTRERARLVGREPQLGGEGDCRRGQEAENEKAFHGLISGDRRS